MDKSVPMIDLVFNNYGLLSHTRYGLKYSQENCTLQTWTTLLVLSEQCDFNAGLINTVLFELKISNDSQFSHFNVKSCYTAE